MLGDSNHHFLQEGNPLWKLPISDTRCMNASCEAFVQGYNASQRKYSNELYLNFGLWTTFFWIALIGIFTLLHIRRRLMDLRSARSLHEKFLGCWRFCTYRRLSGRIGEQLDLSYGMLLLLALATLFLTILPCYQGVLREKFRYGSPPLSVRCAMMISALTPVMMLLAGKMNLVTILTGISYAKLNIWHRLVGYAIFVLAIIHTVPHIVAPIQEGGLAELTYLYKIQRREFSGTFVLLFFFLMIVCSLPYIRSRCYEMFNQGHILLALAWFSLMFWHIRNLHATLEFFYGAAGVWACSVIARTIHRNRFIYPISNITRGFPTTLKELPGDMTRVVISVPRRMRWMPGQHCYISIPGISSVGNHPFTIASVPESHYDKDEKNHEMVFLVRECGGFTKLLGTHAKSISAMNLASSNNGTLTPPHTMHIRKSSSAMSLGSEVDRFPLPPSLVPRNNLTSQSLPEICPHPRVLSLTVPEVTRLRPTRSSAPSCISSDDVESQTTHACVSTWVDGPFGGYRRLIQRHYEGFITIPGGSGLTASLPWITYLTSKMRRAVDGCDDEGYDCRMRNVTFEWTIRKAEWICWARQELIQALRAAAVSEGCFLAVIFVTSREIGEQEVKAMQLDLTLAAGLSGGIDKATVEIRLGRPKIAAVLSEYLDKRRNMVRVCGPNALKSGVANAVASLQRLVIQGKVQTIALDSETFGW